MTMLAIATALHPSQTMTLAGKSKHKGFWSVKLRNAWRISYNCHVIIIIIIIIKLSFITRLNKTNLARKRVTEICKNNENKSKTMYRNMR